MNRDLPPLNLEKPIDLKTTDPTRLHELPAFAAGLGVTDATAQKTAVAAALDPLQNSKVHALKQAHGLEDAPA